MSTSERVELESCWQVVDQAGGDADLALDVLEAAVQPGQHDKSPDRRTSIRTTVEVAARLIIALRQKPCQARTTEKATKRTSGIG